jgi:hypothetical protein
MKHERINHYEENPLKSECNICGRPFKNQQQLTKHKVMNRMKGRLRWSYSNTFADDSFKSGGTEGLSMLLLPHHVRYHQS